MTSPSRLALTAVLATALIVVGCAKRPAMMIAASPAPTGAATTTTVAAAPTPAQAAQPTLPPTQATAQAPSQPRPEPKTFVGVPDLRDIHFDFDKADVRAADARILDANATWLNSHRDHLVLIEGHCDERGTNEYNTALGDRRARSARDYLVSKGVAADRISVVSYGEERPVCSDRSGKCWSDNRRAHFLVKPR
jgi:peptidoglycan-associated lipoprotein